MVETVIGILVVLIAVQAGMLSHQQKTNQEAIQRIHDRHVEERKDLYSRIQAGTLRDYTMAKVADRKPDKKAEAEPEHEFVG